MKNHLQVIFWFLGRAHQQRLMRLLLLISLTMAAAQAFSIAPAQNPAVLTVSVSSATVCMGASTTLTATGCPVNGAIRWSTTQTGAIVIVTPLQSTSYTAICDVTSTSATTSTANSGTGIVTTVTTTTATATVVVSAPIILTPTSLSTLCNGGKDGQVSINATGGTGVLQYQFNGQPFQATTTAFGSLTAGTYSVAVKDARGCTVQATIDVKQPPALGVNVTTVTPKCTGGSDGAIFSSASGGVGDYRYILDAGTPQLIGTFLNLKASTTYTLSVTDKNSCIRSLQVPIGSAIPFDIKLTMKPARCAGSADGSITVAATGGSGTYLYQIGTSSFQAGTLFTGLASSTYNITVQDANGCQGKLAIVVGQPAPVQLTAISGPVNCLGATSGSITVTATGGTGTVQYQITTGKAPQTSPTFTGLALGDYTIVGTDANGCTGLVAATVNKAEPLKVQAVSIAATCCVCPTGAIRLTTTGGIGTARKYQIIGQSYQVNSQINGLRPNSYRLRAADEVGCTDSTVAVLTDGNAITLTTGTIKDVTCAGGHEGEATVFATGGKKPFKFYWTTEQRDTLKPFTASQSGLSEGTYTVSIVDSNRCSTNTVFVPIKSRYPVPFKPTVTQSRSSTLLVDQSVGVQWYVRTGNDPGKAIVNATSPALVPFQSGQYYVIITTNGCSSPPSEAINFILTALSDPVFGLAVRVVPNPVVDQLRLEIEQIERSAITFQLLDASGRAVMTGLMPAFTGKKQAEWPLSGIETGSYLLKVNADSRQSISRVVVE